MEAVADNIQKYWDALKEVNDPEFPISVVDMGLIYHIQINEGVINLTMTFTAVSCACMDWIKEDIETRLLKELEVKEVNIEVVWSPPWTVDRMSPEGRERMKRWGVSSK
ncbi:metal-sulfur cluster assembly factor [Siminovitchia terrae]|uniref:Metal-sulfur cluster assembly factor n=1 Tax=Siminovitchia terrae TaxID=1914933 RepID=A0A429X0P6_SIMTE|nr:metal-sulfur cluster assembly factor [Siminovitchia terrae]RST57022.1 metal-sulfur cluster assembly factor [Siminovitchia terrae]